jgi:hypothetical protein
MQQDRERGNQHEESRTSFLGYLTDHASGENLQAMLWQPLDAAAHGQSASQCMHIIHAELLPGAAAVPTTFMLMLRA